MRGLSHALLVVVLVLATLASSCGREQRTIRIATGMRGGTFLPLGETLARSFSRDLPEVDFVAVESAGGSASIEMVERGEADLALLSNHVAGSSELRLIAPLYQETLQVVMRTDAGVASIADLRGRRVSTGPGGQRDRGDRALGARDTSGCDAERRSRAAPHDDRRARRPRGRGAWTSAFMVAGMRTPAVDRAARS
jgi:TRAP transporter TAXI family solute receptor